MLTTPGKIFPGVSKNYDNLGKDMRLSVKKHHEQYLQLIASQMGINDSSEALNMLLWELRRINYAFGSPFPQLPSPQPEQLAHSGLSFIPQSPQAIQEFEELREEIDPVIEKFISLGLVDQF